MHLEFCKSDGSGVRRLTCLSGVSLPLTTPVPALHVELQHAELIIYKATTSDLTSTPCLMPASKRRKAKPLSSGRPPLSRKAPVTLSSKATRALIREHHQLDKEYANALRNGYAEVAEKLEAKKKEKGGIDSYQLASLMGQSAARGGDSSKVLVPWLDELLMRTTADDLSWSDVMRSSPRLVDTDVTTVTHAEPLRLLEIGSLNPSNQCSRSPLFAHGDCITRIDLHSQHPRIQRQDFMDRPLPDSTDDQFDVISLSLVLNFVPDPAGRGEMLKRTRAFLRPSRHRNENEVMQNAMSNADKPQLAFPCLFVVLPAPCVTNSRYMTEDRLGEIMKSLGFMLLRSKMTAKLVYYLWRFDGYRDQVKENKSFAKKELNPGGTRNNFCVVLS